MSKNPPSTTDRTQQALPRGTLRSYVIGFTLSILLTLAAYSVVVQKLLSGWTIIAAVVGLAILQLLVQLLFFLHLGRETKPRWNVMVFLFMLLVLIIIVFGTLWIMHNLNYHMMPPAETDMHIIKDEGYEP